MGATSNDISCFNSKSSVFNTACFTPHSPCWPWDIKTNPKMRFDSGWGVPWRFLHRVLHTTCVCKGVSETETVTECIVKFWKVHKFEKHLLDWLQRCDWIFRLTWRFSCFVFRQESEENKQKETSSEHIDVYDVWCFFVQVPIKCLFQFSWFRSLSSQPQAASIASKQTVAFCRALMENWNSSTVIHVNYLGQTTMAQHDFKLYQCFYIEIGNGQFSRAFSK